MLLTKGKEKMFIEKQLLGAGHEGEKQGLLEGLERTGCYFQLPFCFEIIPT